MKADLGQQPLHNPAKGLGIADICIDRPVFALMMSLALVVVGLLSYARLGVDLVPAVEQPTEAPRMVVVAVDAQGRYAINARLSEARDPGSLAQAMKEAANGNADAVVEVHADALASHQSVIHVLEAARLAGLARVRFSARSQKK